MLSKILRLYTETDPAQRQKRVRGSIFELLTPFYFVNKKYDDIKQDMLNIVLIGLAKKLPRQDEKHELHRLLGALLSKSLTQSGKLNIIEKEYDIPLEEDLRKNFSRIRRQTGYGSFYKLLLTGVERIKIGHTNKKYGGMS